MTVVDLIGQLAVHPQKTYGQRPLSAITRAVVHHTAGSITQTPDAIARYHVQHNDWPGIGYSALVSFEGVVYKCWPATTVTYCVKNGNTPSLCVALIGDFTFAPPSAVQWWATIELVKEWKTAYNLAQVFGHREVPTIPPQSTACPGARFSLDDFRRDLESISV